MAISLQDQLLKAGVASKKQANKAKADKRKKKGAKTPEINAEQLAQQQLEQQKKREKDKQLNLAREKERVLKANIAQARQIIESQRITIGKDAEIQHQFSHLKFVKSIYIDKAIQQQLFRGQLTIVFMDEKYWLIPTDQAHRVLALQAEWIVEMPKEEKVEEDDPYADYQVPDDLMW